MRTDRRGSITIEALMVLPIAVMLILLGRYIMEGSLNRQEISVFARGGAVAAGLARSTGAADCDFDRQDFTNRPAVDQTATINCTRRDSERGLSREDRMWDAVEDGAAPWPEILRDVKPGESPRDIVAEANVALALTSPAFLAQQNDTDAKQSYVAPENVYWDHDEDDLAEGHDHVIWEELCHEATYQLFPNVFPNAQRPRC